MLKIKNTIRLLFLVVGIIAFTGCGSGQKEKSETSPVPEETRAVQALVEERNELVEQASAELSEVNEKVMKLNEMIEARGEPLSEELNNRVDSFAILRQSINERVGLIENVSVDDWEIFRERLEADLEEANEDIEEIMQEL